MKTTYKKLQSYIKEPLPAVEVSREKIIFHAFEVESVDDLGGDDYELDIKVLPDRAHDAKDERGMAREVAALFNLNLIEPDIYDKNTAPQVTFSLEKISQLFGRSVSLEEIKNVFDAYHYHYEIGEGTVTLFIPPWRTDFHNVHDICDELGRYIGYDTIPAILPNLSKGVRLPSLGGGLGWGYESDQNMGGKEYLAITAKKQEMISQGYHEVMTYSLTKKGDFQVAKGPKGKDFLRTDLLTGLRQAYALNKQNEVLLPNHTAKIFEIGKVFKKSGEELHIAWIDEKGEHEEILDVEGLTEKTLSTLVERVGAVRRPGEDVRFSMWSEYPFITRDVAVWLPESADPNELVAIIKNHGGDLIQGEPWLFDQFTKEGKTSYAYRMIFQAYDRTLTDDEIAPKMTAMYNEIQEKGWQVR